MRKKLLFGAVCVCVLASLMGCGDKKETTDENGTTETVTVSDEVVATQDATEVSKDSVDDSVGAWILRKEVSDVDVLEDAQGAMLFADKLSLPISMDILQDYPMDSVGINQNKLSDIANENKDSFTSLVFTVYDKTGNKFSYLPDVILGNDKTETTVAQAISDGNWRMETYYFDYETLGLTEEEYNDMCNSNPDVQGMYLLLDRLYEMLGTPNFVGWDYGMDNSTKDDSGYDAAKYVETMRYPEKVSDECVTVYSTIVGWQFSDYAIVVDISEISDSRSGVSIGEVSDVIFNYIPSSYGTIEDVYGTNAIKDYIAER